MLMLAGKSATTRGEKLAQRRAEQRSKVLESIHALWAEAKEKGFFTVDLDQVSPVFREKLYAFSPTIVGKVLPAPCNAWCMWLFYTSMLCFPGAEEAVVDLFCGGK